MWVWRQEREGSEGAMKGGREKKVRKEIWEGDGGMEVREGKERRKKS